MAENPFQKAYKGLNKAQKEAVGTIEGPVMVIAGPGTGKTQVLALRIANILEKTDTPPDGVLCLTFTNSGVKAMRERLFSLIGPAASRVVISTFHSFGANLLEEFYETLGMSEPPKLLDERDAVLLADELLETHEWEYLRPRSGGAQNFRDLKSLISFLKRENVGPQDFAGLIDADIKRIKSDPESISSRGARKGELKSEAVTRIERLGRTKEAAKFYELYESTKKDRALADYDDILEHAVRLVETSPEARATIAERYLYVLIDEHQDSSGIQNKFLEAVWGKVEKPNIFVVGDDRQLIYGFGGASLSHLEGFRDTFSDTALITLTDNYRSTQNVLDAADKLLGSSIAKGKLVSSKEDSHKLELIEAPYQRDEILAAGLSIKEKLKSGLSPADCAVLVPKNAQVRSAIEVLKDLGLPVAAGGRTSFFALRETQTFLTLMRSLANPLESSYVAQLILDPLFGIPVLTGHRYLRSAKKDLGVESLIGEDGPLGELGDMCALLLQKSSELHLYDLVQEIGKSIFFKTEDHKRMIVEIEVVRTMLHLALSRLEKDPKVTLTDFVAFIERLEEYGEDIPLAVFGSDEGVKVMTMHGSKGLEFEYVWVAHLDERSLMKGKASGFTLPESLSAHAAKKDELTARRELYVAITRAKRFCTLSYARQGYAGGDMELARIIAELPESIFDKTSAVETEKAILKSDPLVYATASEGASPSAIDEIVSLVKAHALESSLSVTHLNNFFSCPWKWYFRNFLRLPEPESESLVFGDLAHKLINEQLKEGAYRHDFRHEIEGFLDALRVFDQHKRKRFFKDADAVLSRFQDAVLPHISSDFATEKALRHSDGGSGLTLTGKLDLVEQLEDGTLRVTDFKTGTPKTASSIEKESGEGRLSDLMRQLAMYSYLLMNQRKTAPVSSSKLIFLEAEETDKNFMYETEIGKNEIAMLEKDISDFAELVGSGKWATEECHNDAYGKSCEYCRLKERLLRQ